MASLGIGLPFAKSGFASLMLPAPLSPVPEQHTRPAPPPVKTFLSPDDDQFLDELERRDLKRGLVTMCAAGGMAPAIIIERI